MWRLAQLLAAVFLLSVPSGVWAEAPEPFPEFTFKRVKVPKPGSGPRIRVQIAPKVESNTDSAAVSDTAAPAESDAYAWFWEKVSPSATASGPGRLANALSVLDGGDTVQEPRVAVLHSIIEAHASDLLLATIGTQVSPALALAVISTESSGRSDAVSSAGAQGLMQLMPDTATRFGAEDAMVPGQNIKAGVAYLDWLMKEFDGDPVLILAAYNAGENAVKRYEGVPPFDETRGYVPKVLAAWRVARGLCQTPPDLISDGCAFQRPGS